jgi:hypothetical protein
MKSLSVIRMFKVLWGMWVHVRPLRELRIEREQIAKDNFQFNRRCGKYTYMEALTIAFEEREEIINNMSSMVIGDKELSKLTAELSMAAVWGLPQLFIVIAGIVILIR